MAVQDEIDSCVRQLRKSLKSIVLRTYKFIYQTPQTYQSGEAMIELLGDLDVDKFASKETNCEETIRHRVFSWVVGNEVHEVVIVKRSRWKDYFEIVDVAKGNVTKFPTKEEALKDVRRKKTLLQL